MRGALGSSTFGGGPFVWGFPRKIRKIWIFRKIRILFFSLFFGKIGQNPPRSLKLDAGNRSGSISAQSEQIWPISSIFFIFFLNFWKKFKKSGPKMKHFSTFSQRPSPQAPWNPSPEQKLAMAVSHDKFSSRLDQMAPHSCPFEISNFDTFSTTPPKHVWDFWESPTG